MTITEIKEEHKAHNPSKLTILEGAVIYDEKNRAVELM